MRQRIKRAILGNDKAEFYYNPSNVEGIKNLFKTLVAKNSGYYCFWNMQF